MKNLYKLPIVALVLLTFACSKSETPAIIPTSSFTQDRKIIEPGETVTFTNSSTEAVSYLWEFGDNGTSTDQNPTHTFTSTGSFTVKLTTTSETGDEAVITSKVTVGNRWSTALGIVTIQFTNTNGEAWDTDGSGPELFFGFEKVTATSFVPFEIGTDMDSDDFPVGGTISAESQVMFTDENWAFIFVDNDEPFDNLNTSETMASIVVNPVTVTSTKDYETGEGTFEVNVEGFNFLIAFEVR